CSESREPRRADRRSPDPSPAPASRDQVRRPGRRRHRDLPPGPRTHRPRHPRGDLLMSTGNARHQQAVDATNAHVEQLRDDISLALTRLAATVKVLDEDLAGTRQIGGLGVISEAAREARDKQVRLDREAARGMLAATAVLGQGWMVTPAVLGTGQTKAP